MDYMEQKETRAKAIARKQKKTYGMFTDKPKNIKKHQIAQLRQAEAGAGW